MTLKEVMALVNAGYTKSEIQAMAADQQPAAAAAQQAQDTAAHADGAASKAQTTAQAAQEAAQAAQSAAVPRQPMTPSDVPPVTLSDVLGAVNQLAAKISTPAPAPAFGEPQPRGLDDIVTGFLGVTAPNAPKQ